jgi:hypothetical protein
LLTDLIASLFRFHFFIFEPLGRHFVTLLTLKTSFHFDSISSHNMSAVVDPTIETADAAAGNVAPTLPMRKRKKADEEPVPGVTPEPSEMKLFKEEWLPESAVPPPTTDSLSSDDEVKPAKRGPMSKAREIRLVS